MRILYLHQHFRVPSQGGGIRSYELARRWVEDGHDVVVITSDTSGETSKTRQTSEAGIEVHWTSIRYHQTMKLVARLQAFTSFAVQASVLARRLGPFDVVLATSAPLTIAIPGVIAARSHRAPLLFEVRDLWPEVPIALGALPFAPLRWSALGLERVAYRTASHIVALSPGMKDGVVRAGKSANAISVIPNSSDRDIFDVDPSVGELFRQDTTWLGNRPLLVYTGAFGVVNNALWLIELLAEISKNDPEVQMLLVGFGTQEEEIVEAAKAAGLWKKNVHLMSYVSKDVIASILSAADLSFSTISDIPALQNNSANKVFDSFAARTPVAINHDGWLADLLRQSGAGLVLPAGDISASATAVLELLSDETAKTKAGRAASDLAKGPFSRDAHAEEYLRLLTELASTGQATPISFV